MPGEQILILHVLEAATKERVTEEVVLLALEIRMLAAFFATREFSPLQSHHHSGIADLPINPYGHINIHDLHCLVRQGVPVPRLI